MAEPIAIGDGNKEAHEEIVNNGANSMPVPRKNDKDFWRSTNTKKTVRCYLPRPHRVPRAILRNKLKLQVLAMQKEDSGEEKSLTQPRTKSDIETCATGVGKHMNS